jgi:hypothetical protein
MFIATANTRFAALLAEIDLGGADRFQGLPSKGRGQIAVCRPQAFLDPVTGPEQLGRHEPVHAGSPNDGKPQMTRASGFACGF